MDVLFIQLPRYKRNPNKRIQPQLGIAYIASYLLQKGLQVRVVDGEVDGLTIDGIVEQIRDVRPMAVGITTPTEDRFHAFELAAKVKASFGDVLVFAGGPHFTYSAQDALEHVPGIDVIVMGEGEFTSYELIKAFERDRSVHAFHYIKGCAFRDENGQIIVTPKRDVIMELDEMPMPAWHLYDMDKYHGTLSVEGTTRAVGIISSRGCPFRCVFCSNSLNRKVRYRNPKLFVDEIEFLKERYGFPGVNIQDDSFTANPKHVFGICEEILRRGLKIQWYSSLRVDNVTHDLLLLMKEAGCVALGYGIETGSERLLKLIKKGITTDQIRNAVRITRQVGFKHVWLFTMTSLPGQTREDIRISSEFLSEMLSVLRGRPVREVFIGSPTLIYPGTETELIARRNGNVFNDDFSWNTYYETRRAKVLKSNQFVPHFENPGLSLEDIYADAVALAQAEPTRPPAASSRCFQSFFTLKRKANESRHLILNSCRRMSLLLRISLKRWLKLL